MTDEERTKVNDAWSTLMGMFKKEATDNEMELVFRAFDSFTPDEVKDAIGEYLRSGKYAPVPADIIEIIKRRKGLDKASLEIAADKWFNNFVASVSFRCDNVTTDERAVAAFYIAFGSLSHFGALSSNADKTEIYKANFRRVYVNVGEADIRAAGNVIYGEVDPVENTVQLLGNRKEAKALVPILYPGKRIIINNDPDRRPLPPPEEKPRSPEERRQALEQVEQALAMLRGMMK